MRSEKSDSLTFPYLKDEMQSQKSGGRVWLIVELAVLFLVFPLLYLFNLVPFHKLIPLVMLFLYCISVLIIHKRINRERFGVEANWKAIVLRFFLIGSLVLVLLKFVSPDAVFADLKENRKLLYMLLMYPFLSAFPQELIFREFFFYRYRSILPSPVWLLIVNVLLFAFAHIYFANWIVIVFTLIGGLIFSLTYLKTRSLLVVTIEHTLYGLLILSSGLAEYFYKAF